jgi:hypothetical protein
MWKWANQIDNKPTLFNAEKMDVDTTFEIIGEFGPYQKRTYFLLCLMPFMTSFHTLLSSFILATPEHRFCYFFLKFYLICIMYFFSN